MADRRPKTRKSKAATTAEAPKPKPATLPRALYHASEAAVSADDRRDVVLVLEVLQRAEGRPSPDQRRARALLKTMAGLALREGFASWGLVRSFRLGDEELVRNERAESLRDTLRAMKEDLRNVGDDRDLVARLALLRIGVPQPQKKIAGLDRIGDLSLESNRSKLLRAALVAAGFDPKEVGDLLRPLDGETRR